LNGTKPYDAGITCCSSSGARGMALVPQAAVFTGGDGALVVNLLEAAHGTAVLGGRRVSFELGSDVPRTGAVKLTFGGELPATFAMRVRLSDWAVPAVLRIGSVESTIAQAGWCEVPARAWQAGEPVELAVRCRLTKVTDRHDEERVALQWGPCVLALANAETTAASRRLVAGFVQPRLLPGSRLRIACALQHGMGREPVELATFADIGAGGESYRVWLAGMVPGEVAVASEARSRAGNVAGAIADGDRDSLVVTYDGQRAAEDWYSIAFASPQELARVAFAHGHAFHDGGWFDASKGRPKVQVRAVTGEWQTVGELADYPPTTATDREQLVDGQLFTLQLDRAVTAVEVRVIGTPACGDNPAQAFSSCAELMARR
jgi:hypothetical protein